MPVIKILVKIYLEALKKLGLRNCHFPDRNVLSKAAPKKILNGSLSTDKIHTACVQQILAN